MGCCGSKSEKGTCPKCGAQLVNGKCPKCKDACPNC